MNIQHAKGASEKGQGKVKEIVGHVAGDKKLENEGRSIRQKGHSHHSERGERCGQKDPSTE
jgi:uncharacterized protein YjbJ (UPF0337 family)